MPEVPGTTDPWTVVLVLVTLGLLIATIIMAAANLSLAATAAKELRAARGPAICIDWETRGWESASMRA